MIHKRKMVVITTIIAIILLAIGFVGGLYWNKMFNIKTDEIIKAENGLTNNIVSDSVEDAIEKYAVKETDIDVDNIKKQISDTVNDYRKEYEGSLNIVDGIPLIVCLGDSVMESHRDGNSSIPNLIGAKCGANVINLAMEDASASISVDVDAAEASNYSHSGIGVADAMAGLYDVNLLDNSSAKSIIKENPDIFKEADVFIVEYGIYDYLQGNRIDNMDNLNDPASYQGALQRIIKAIRTIAPDATILLMKPSICELKDEYGNSYTRNIYGSLYDYAMKIECVDDPSLGIEFYDTNIENGLNMYSQDRCLSDDGITLTDEGRRLYADLVGGFLNRVVFKTEPPLQ